MLLLLKESVLFAWQSLVVNKLRSFLSLLGITIGIFAIILVFTVVDGLESNMRGTLRSLGSNVIYVQKWPWLFSSDYPWWKFINRPIPEYKEMVQLGRRVKSAEAVAFRLGARRTLKYKSNSVERAVVGGISHDYYKIKAFELVGGRYFTLSEVEAGNRLVILGAEIAEGLFGDEDPVGRDIKIAGLKATVIGVLKKEGESMLGMSFDYQVFIPFNFARYVMDVHSENADPTIYAKAKPQVSNAEMIDELRGQMRSLRKLKPRADDNFALNEPSMLSSQFEIVFDVIGTAGWIIGGFSILVGGFGIANIMFVSVRERTSLIGIQKSLGARNFFILSQFLCESIFLCIIGGCFGLLLTFAATSLGKDIFDMEITLTAGNVVLGFTISILIGLISGFIPAYSASQLDPVEAIRSN